jgi:hypothetical protein
MKSARHVQSPDGAWLRTGSPSDPSNLLCLSSISDSGFAESRQHRLN